MRPMLCDRCKMKEAKIFYTEIVDGKKREQRICEDCAAELTNFNKDLSLGSILSGLLASAGIGTGATGSNSGSDTTGSDIQCPSCGMSYPVFRHVGKFGCAECYKAFGKLLQGNIKRIQGSTEHTGKVPVSWVEPEPEESAEVIAEQTAEQMTGQMAEQSSQPEPEQKAEQPTLAQLEHDLKAAILAEEYEEAARLRDEIRERRASEKGKGDASDVR